MLNMLPKGMIVGSIVDTLKKDPENGVIKLLEKLSSSIKGPDEQALLRQVMTYYATSATAKMQIRNLVYNTSRRTLYAFAEKVYDAVSRPPILLTFMHLVTMDEAAKLPDGAPVFPVIDLKNLNEASKKILTKLKNEGQIFFVSIAVTEENFIAATSDEVVLMLIKHGVRAIFYRLNEDDKVLEQQLLAKIKQVRTGRPILAFLMKKDVLNNSTSLVYRITENVNGKDYHARLRLR